MQHPQSTPSVTDRPDHPVQDNAWPSTTNLPLVSVHPASPDLLTIPNPLPPTNHPTHRGEYIAKATSSIPSGTVNVVGHDQINVTNIYMNPNPSGEENAGQPSGTRIQRNTENVFPDPLFNNLSHVVKASYDASMPTLRRACTEHTRTDILEAIKEWAFDVTKPKIYWMNGKAGTGKTTIAYTFSVSSETQGILGATFFCSRLVDECTKVDRIFPTIAYHLARNYPPIASTILHVLKNDPDAATRTINRQFTDLIVKPIRASAEELAGIPIIIIIDALDECANQTEVRTLLSVIFQQSSELPFKIFITSRPEQVFRVGFNRQDPDCYSKLILHDIERDVVNVDIKLYFSERFVEMVEGRSDFEEFTDDWPPEDKVDILTQQSNGLFIFAKTVCDYIEEHGGNILERLNAVARLRGGSDASSGDTFDTSELDRLYRDILDRAIPTRPKERDRLKEILSAIISIRNPISSRGLGTLLKIDPGAVKSALSSLHSVISVPQYLGAPISTFHASFPDFLVDPNRSHQHFLSSSASHRMLAKSCLSLMNSSLKENICGLEGRPPNNTITNETITTHISEGLAYACIYWVSHLTSSGKEEIRKADDVRALLDEFLHEHVLHWMECLSILNRLNIAIECLRVIEGWVLDAYPELSATITDARRFILENFDVIHDYCLETYHSALVWLPVQSIIRKHHATQKPDLPKVLVGLRKSWGPCEKVIICGSAVYSMALSSDGSRIVVGLEDGTVQIWNAQTGVSEGILKGHSGFVFSVAFSNDGNHLVSGSFDRTARIWNALMGELERVLEGHSRLVNSVAFSSDGSHIVSGSSDHTVRIWNTLTGELVRVLEGHSSSVSSVAFSGDGSHVASSSDDKTVRIWNTVEGQLEVVLEHSDTVSSVAFSSDGIHIVSASDEAVWIWNAVTGGTENRLKGHSRYVRSVAFSNDGSRVVSGSYDQTVRIWNAITGEEESILCGHSGFVTSVAFSNDGIHVVSGSHDCSIRIWNAAAKTTEDVPESHSSVVLSVAFSNDGSRLVSGSGDCTARIWNVLTGELERVLGHSSSVLSVAFSSDGKHVLTGSSDNKLRIWNVLTGDLKSILVHSTWVSSAAFSSEGSHVVFGSGYNTVCIWNLLTGELERVLGRHWDRVLSVAFSSDGTRVVSGSVDRTARIWNALTGAEERAFEHPQPVSSAAFSSDSSHVVSASLDHTVRIWSVVTGELECVLHGYSDSTLSNEGNHVAPTSLEKAFPTGSVGADEPRRLPFVQLSDQTVVRYRPYGKFVISAATCDPHAHHHIPCNISSDMAWAQTDPVHRCWIPQRYRDFRCIDSYGSKLVLGLHSGTVILLATDLTGTVT